MTNTSNEGTDSLLDRGINAVTGALKRHTPKSLRTGAATVGLAALTLLGAGDATGQSVETYNHATMHDATPSIENVTMARDKINNGALTDIKAGASLYVPQVDADLRGKLTTTTGAGFNTGTDVYAFTEHDVNGADLKKAAKSTDLELKVNQSIGDHKATAGYAPTTGEAYAGFRANHFGDTGIGAHIKRAADGDVDIGGNIYKHWDSGAFTGLRKEDDLAIGVLGAPSGDGPAFRVSALYGVEDNDGFRQTQAYLTMDSEPTFYGLNSGNLKALSTGDVIGGDDAQTTPLDAGDYRVPHSMFLSDGPTVSVTETDVAGTQSLDVEAFTNLESIGAEDVLVGSHAETTLDKPGLQRLGVDLGYNGDNINAAVSVGSGPDGTPVGEVTFHYNH